MGAIVHSEFEPNENGGIMKNHATQMLIGIAALLMVGSASAELNLRDQSPDLQAVQNGETQSLVQNFQHELTIAAAEQAFKDLSHAYSAVRALYGDISDMSSSASNHSRCYPKGVPEDNPFYQKLSAASSEAYKLWTKSSSSVDRIIKKLNDEIKSAKRNRNYEELVKTIKKAQLKTIKLSEKKDAISEKALKANAMIWCRPLAL